jgi:uncharacterized protein (TIGR03492 family)
VTRLLFVSNGHGEAAIAARIGREARALAPDAELAHFPLVGGGLDGAVLREVGPRRAMPSGGLVAMGNVRAFARDLGAGFAALFARQVRFLRGERGAYDAAVAVGDAYALGMTLLTRLPALFVGTAKSVYVAPYGPFERVVLSRAARVYVRDERTAAALRAAGVHALAPGNVIADLAQDDAPALPGAWIGLLPGSRAEAYADAVALGRVVRALRAAGNPGDALLSIAPSLEPAPFAVALGADGWAIEHGAAPTPFTARAGGARIVAWSGGLGAIFRASSLVLGQAGTANEAAAAAGLPVVALDPGGDAARDWYRMRQHKLLGEALAIVPFEPVAAAQTIGRLLADGPRLAAMRAAGQERMGAPGGAGRIAAEALALAARNPAAS